MPAAFTLATRNLPITAHITNGDAGIDIDRRADFGPGPQAAVAPCLDDAPHNTGQFHE
jgi:hypothetical protein